MMHFAAAAKALGAPMQGADIWLSEVSTDSRNLNPGALFVALRGPNFDGHRFRAAAAERGAAALLVSNGNGNGNGNGREQPLPFVRVKDTMAALAQLANWWRGHFTLPLIGVTGSNGKTTVKEMIGHILNEEFPALVTQGNYNNHIGVPLTLLRLRETHQAAVVEMGMSQLGEIAHLSALAQPTIALITNAQPSHLEGLGTTHRVALAKAEIFQSMSADGVTILNADDPFYPLWRDCVTTRTVRSFGFDRAADVRVSREPYDDDSPLGLYFDDQSIEVNLALPGRHNALNAAAAAAAAIAAGASTEAIRDGLERARAVTGRLNQCHASGGGLILDDTYNANPFSVQAGLSVLAGHRAVRVAVLGDMAELGEAGPRLHYDIGETVRRLGIDVLFVFGPLSVETARGYGPGAMHFGSRRELLQALQPFNNENTVFLIKGSRSYGMEAIVKGLAADAEAEAEADAGAGAEADAETQSQSQPQPQQAITEG